MYLKKVLFWFLLVFIEKYKSSLSFVNEGNTVCRWFLTKKDIIHSDDEMDSDTEDNFEQIEEN